MIKRYRKSKMMHAVVESGNVLYLGGFAAADISVGMKEQSEQIFSKIDELLAEQGSDKTQILSATLYVTDISQKDAMNEAWLAWLDSGDFPARATIGVSDLGDPRRLIEVVVTAAKN